MTDPWGEVSELEVQECPPSTLRNELTTSHREVPELEVRKLETWMAGPPPKLETSSMVGSLEVLPVGPGALSLKLEDVGGRLPGGAAGMSGSGHHRS
jgi:hypothetical protein